MLIVHVAQGRWFDFLADERSSNTTSIGIPVFLGSVSCRAAELEFVGSHFELLEAATSIGFREALLTVLIVSL